MSTANEQPQTLFFLHGEIKTPPFSEAARLEAGALLRRLQDCEIFGMPHSRPMPSIGPRCHELRIKDENRPWRVVYRVSMRGRSWLPMCSPRPLSRRRRPRSTVARRDSPGTMRLWPRRGRKDLVDKHELEALEAAGFRATTVAEFLGLTEVEEKIVEFRVMLARAVREGREAKGLTQKQLAGAIGSSQSRIAKLESATADTSVDLMLKALFTVGRQVPEGLAVASSSPEPKPARKPKAKTKA
ncbi:helix-turn-helix domain-containing protein [Singulisphaera sp. GP187]|uniref:helix-turn-helix domain-containing protein n=1 Tax=Singulisphaera sp. GP187 TaxID=1882752 RepID=UPI0020B11C8E|nr:helix-turn-helix domain-containing protein [Singulisphaera sp. GP187]